jgi:hypothetical protein
MNDLPESTIESYVRQKLDGKSYSEIKSQLRKSGLSEEEVRETVRQIDRKVLRAEVNRANRKRASQFYWAGITLAVAGLLITLGHNAGLFLAGWPRLLVYTPFFTGIILMVYGRMLQRRQPDPFDIRTGKIRKKRPNRW